MEDRSLSTGEMCALLGITPPALRLYEKYNKSIRYLVSDSNGYRTFPFESLAQLLGFKCMLNIGMALKDVAPLTEHVTLESLASTFARQKGELQLQIARLTAMMEQAETMRSRIEGIESLVGTFWESESPSSWYLDLNNGYIPSSNKGLREELRRWSDYIPLVTLSPFMKRSDDMRTVVPTITLEIEDRYAGFLAPQERGHAFHLGPRRCISTVSFVRYSRQIDRESLSNEDKYYYVIEGGMEYLSSHGLALTGDVITRLIATNVRTDVDEGASYDYYQIWFPIDS